MFTQKRLLALAPGCLLVDAEAFALRFEHFSRSYEIDSSLRAAHLMAQLAHESGGFTRLIENLNYSAVRLAQVWPRLASRAQKLAHNPQALANAAYANKLGNGDESSGDGWKYIGRGLIQLTGKSNYSEHGVAVGLALVSRPEVASIPELAVEIALNFWKVRKCNVQADRDDVEGVTELINGPALIGIQERRILTTHAKKIFVEDGSLIS